jgi:hypothetical protein
MKCTLQKHKNFTNTSLHFWIICVILVEFSVVNLHWMLLSKTVIFWPHRSVYHWCQQSDTKTNLLLWTCDWSVVLFIQNQETVTCILDRLKNYAFPQLEGHATSPYSKMVHAHISAAQWGNHWKPSSWISRRVEEDSFTWHWPIDFFLLGEGERQSTCPKTNIATALTKKNIWSYSYLKHVGTHMVTAELQVRCMLSYNRALTPPPQKKNTLHHYYEVTICFILSHSINI